MTTQSTLKLELTPEQQEQIRKQTGQEVPQVKLNLETLEERIAPGFVSN